ncbi:protein AF-9 [Monomorium pharaonis]|uniref:protein AF-9 n=1 Tax=Monomorium pharaonis TaxID=307658 RepID=UPI00063F6761|nr:protein AF-9 [Monomorium pharaonis]
MAVRITLECGHTSMLRMRTTPEGYTHDWEVFVRGVDNADIHHYIEKVVFLLHDTFRNPKRVFKEPPFVVKESGYAGFIIPIEVYLKNKDEPKKFQISYDLHLQPSGPPINKTIRHVEVFRNPSDDFRKKLLKGGAVIVSSRDGSLEKSDTKSSAMVGKPKLNGSESKKHRVTESKTSNQFHDLFGPPIKTTPIKISPDSKKTSQSDKNLVPKPLAVPEKSDKVDKTIKSKESPHKDSRKDKVDEKKDKKVRDSSKEQLKSKEKSKRPPSPGNKSHLSPGSKRPASPVVTKKSLSPLPPTKRPPSPKSKEKEAKKIGQEKEKDNKEKEKIKNNSRSDVDSSKSEKKKDKKKHKDDRDKERKDKYKESEKANVKDVAKIIEKKPEKTDKAEKSDKEKLQEYKSSKDGRKSPKPGKENDKVKDDKSIKEKTEKSEKSDKVKDGRSDKEHKHKHKKREKKDKRDSKDREKKEKRDKSKEESEKQNNASSLVSNPLTSLLTENPERDSSDSAPSMNDDDSLPESKSMLNIKKEPEHVVLSTIPAETAKPLSPGISVEIKKEKSERSRRDKSKGSRGEERESRKRKRSKEDDEVVAKREKSRGQSTSPPLEPVSSSQSPVAMDIDSIHHSEKETKKDFRKEKDGHAINMADNVLNDTDPEQVAPDSTINSTDAEINDPPVFSEDYVSQLKDLQQKIMTLQDNDELQRVVQVIAETGQYEITKKTFDFDLCALDRRTVQRLQQFFSAS